MFDNRPVLQSTSLTKQNLLLEDTGKQHKVFTTSLREMGTFKTAYCLLLCKVYSQQYTLLVAHCLAIQAIVFLSLSNVL
jgi:hypothetical protein